MTMTRWRCATCHRIRETGDAYGPLSNSLTPRFKRGKCAGCKGALRYFEPVAAPGKPPGGRDAGLGQKLKERGMAKANGGEDWATAFDAAVTALALSRVEFTSEDVTARVGMPNSDSGSAVGARISAAAKRGQIRWTGRMATAQRPLQHNALLKVWRGL